MAEGGLPAETRRRKQIGALLALGLALSAGTLLLPRAAFAQASLESTPRYTAGPVTSLSDAKATIRVYNYARVDPGLLAGAQKVAAGIFQSVGVQTVWVDCSVSQAKSRAYAACPSQMGTADLVLRILPRRMAKKLHSSEDALGSAQICPETEPACELNVFYSRIDDWAAQGYRAERVLGYVIAHEVAHVLIGGGHSDEGIMRAEWSRYDLQRISWGLALDFTKAQSVQLRSAVARRLRASLPDAPRQTSTAAAR